ncbi:uncharacterized protein LOC114515560 [Dendronephthya gigantea]|uniref:uncharacterized protein LOC114515560 n=1 Tax=Dendronephthya gigantea TaxID=151771 RepID=UPI00106B06FA|nr:uncharacterized protein LOC114515560 [Dendronephthya gigantea]
MTVASPCGKSHLYAPATLKSPHYPSYYPNSIDCKWIISGTNGSRILLTFSSFSLESDSRCSYDYLEVYDGDSSYASKLGRYCGSQLPRSLTSSGSHLFIAFHSDGSIRKEGFVLNFSNKFRRNATQCNRRIDLGFLLDSSGSIGQTNFGKTKSFVKDLITYFKISENNTRVSVISYATTSRLHFFFSQKFVSPQDLYTAIDNISYLGGGTNTHQALMQAYKDMFNGKNDAQSPETKKILIVFTDGQSQGSVEQPSKELKNIGVVIYSIGIGTGVDVSELETMASPAAKDHVFFLPNFQELSTLEQNISSSACNEENECYKCHKQASCINTNGTLHCSCNNGFTGNGSSCTDVDECQNGTNICDSNASCNNTIGSFNCVCNMGYFGDGLTCEEVCTERIDLGFILDSSGSIGRYNFDTTKSFVKDITNNFQISQKNTRVSVISYATWNTLHFPFSRVFRTRQDLYSAIDYIPYNGGGTNTHQALTRAYTDMFNAKNGSRFSGIKKVLIVFTDGKSSGHVYQPSKQLKDVGVVIYSIGIGSGIDLSELKTMASLPASDHVFLLSHFHKLSTLERNISYSACNDVHDCYDCDIHSSCIKTNGSFHCFCNIGYTGDGKKCEDVNECEIGINNCNSNASCNNTNGSFNCVCNIGFIGDGITCEEVTICTERIDLGFILDSSGSISRYSYDKTKSFVKDLTNFFTISQNSTRVSVMSYATWTTLHFPFSRVFGSRQDLYSAIDNIPYSGGGTNTHLALLRAYTDMFIAKNGSRLTGVKKVLIIFTDGRSSGHVYQPSQQLKNIGVVIYSIGIGSGIHLSELRTMASPPANNHVFLLSNFHELSTLEKNISHSACNDDYECYHCDIHASCLETNGSFHCFCNVGFGGDGYSCTDVDECQNGTNICDSNASCNNTIGSFNCVCNMGYFGDGLTCEKVCTERIDLGFILDSSGSIGRYNFDITKSFVKDITNNFQISQKNTRVSVISYATWNTLHFRFSRVFRTRQDLYSAIDYIPYNGGGTNTHQALTRAYTDMFNAKNGSRFSGIKKVLIVFTDGKSSGHVYQPSKQLKDVGVVIYSIGIGSGIDLSELKTMASLPASDHVFLLSHFHKLSTLERNISYSACNDVHECYDCDIHSSCIKTNGSFHCFCNNGYTGDGKKCEDVDECQNGTNICDSNASCNNTIGSFNCVCNMGYFGDGLTCEKVCTERIDLGFILDSSGSIGRYNFDITKSFVKDITNNFQISQKNTRVSVISYATWNTLHFRFSRVFRTRQDLYSAIDYIPYNGGGTNTHQALTRAYTDMFNAKNGSRFSGIKKVLIVFTDGKSSGHVYQPSKQLKDVGVVIYSIGIGSGIDLSELKTMASLPASDHVFLLSHFHKLSTLERNISYSACNDVHECYDCDIHSSCIKTNGSFHCFCNNGYTGDGKKCEDVNECEIGINNCNSNASCNNTNGSFNCVCNIGFIGDGITCEKITICTERIDLGFILDSSGSISRYSYDKTKSFVKDLTNFFTISQNSTRVSVMSYASWTTLHFPFSRVFGTRQDLYSAIDNIPYSGGGTNTHLALLRAYTDMFNAKNGSRLTGVKKVLIVFTDGQSSGHVYQPSQQLKNIGVVIYSIGIGSGIRMSELRTMASPPANNHVFLLSNFHELSTLEKNISHSACNDIYECHHCDIHASCHNTKGLFRCFCNIGYTGDGLTCTDVNECENGTNNCNSNASCSNTIGSFRCACNDGYVGDGITCRNATICTKEIDLGFVMDSSGSIGLANFNKSKSFIKDFTDYFKISQNETRVSVITYATWPTLHFGFSRKFRTRQDLYSAIDNIQYMNGGSTYTGRALTKAYTAMFDSQNGARMSGIKRILIVFTDGKSSGNVYYPSQQLKNMGVVIFSIGVGSGIDVSELKTMASSPAKDHVFLLSNFNEFVPLAQNMSFYACNGSTTNIMPVSTTPRPTTPTPGSCGNSYLYTPGRLTSPFYPSYYPGNTDCSWIISTTNGKNISLKFSFFSLEGGSSCPYDYLDVYDGNSVYAKKLGRFCGQQLPRKMISSSSKFFIVFHTDGSIQKRGFVLNYTSTIDTNKCSGAPCGPYANCTKINGSYVCVCKPGYKGNGTICTDINECTEGAPCGSNSHCVNTFGSYYCNCRTGFRGNGINCTDINECQSNPCNVKANCTNIAGSYNCTCHVGFEGDGWWCTDIDECRQDSCNVNAKCSNTYGSYECKCFGGFYGNGKKCTDINECKSNPCDANANCANIPGSYKCSCGLGYEGNGFQCTDIDECNGPNNCSLNAVCHNKVGTYKCDCIDGYHGDGTRCDDIDECKQICNGAGESCTNYPGAYRCECISPGQQFINDKCTDIQASVQGEFRIINRQYIPAFDNKNSAEYFEFTEMLINELTSLYTKTPKLHSTFRSIIILRLFPGSVGLDYLATFSDKKGIDVENIQDELAHSLQVTQNGTFLGNGLKISESTNITEVEKLLRVQDYDECNPKNSIHAPPCGNHATCINTNTSFDCACHVGFAKNGAECADIDECSEDSNSCSANSECKNTIGSFTCSCISGYVRSGSICKETWRELSKDETKWYIFAIISVAGIVIGLSIAYVAICLRRRYLKREAQFNSTDVQHSYHNSFYELDVGKLGDDNFYETVGTAGRESSPTYDELGKVRDPENTYESLK